MKILLRLVGAIALALIPSAATAQSVAALPPRVQSSVIAIGDVGVQASTVSSSNPLPITCLAGCILGRQEGLALVTANVASAALGSFGGNYVLAQSCATYGTLTLQTLGPDGTSWTTLLSKTAADSGGGTAIALGSSAIVRATLSGTSGCNALLTRIP